MIHPFCILGFSENKKHYKMKTQNLAIYIVALFIALITLTGAKPIKTKPNEAIIIGRILIDSQIDLDYEKISLRFINNIKGGKTCKVNANGYFCLKIGTKASFLDYVEYKEKGTFREMLTDNCATFFLPKGETVYYIGDIQLAWTPSERDKTKKGFSIGVGMGGAHMGGGVDIPIQSSYIPKDECPAIDILEYTDAMNWYKENYPDDTRPIETILIETQK